MLALFLSVQHISSPFLWIVSVLINVLYFPQSSQLTAAALSFSFLSASSVLDSHLVASHLELQAVLLEIFQERHRSSAKMPRFMLCFAPHSHISGNISFRHPIWCWRLLLCSVAKKPCLDAC